METRKFVSERIPKARDARAMVQQWNQMQEAMANLKASYQVAEFMEDKQKQEAVTSDIERALGVNTKIEDKLAELFSDLKNVRFLSRDELSILPVHLLEVLGITIEDEEESEEDNSAVEEMVE